MTDITELALRLKLEVHRAVSNFNSQMNIKTRDLKALVEALEKAQQRIAELEEAEQKLCAANVTLDARAELAERQRIAELESRTVSVKLLTPEVRNALKAEGLADVLKDAAEYAPLTAGQWETLTKNWYQTFIGLSGTAAGIKVEAE
ncbi:hypothetical protein [Klebsiella pneumoniae]|uniref:hypothetical protein n=1 Tax=Klebsiella pneumoniae TaxID=573 RepID=UPI001082B3B1|nr:hypothetical protein [Klebsiella pneumoniae]VGG43839.1 Uncharacterised protein [Klebsiella pneumoniae]